MDALYYISGILLVLGIPALLVGLITALIKPRLINNHSIIKTAMSRRQIAKVGITTVLVSFVGLSSVLAATEPASVKQERIAREAAEAKALQIQQQKEADAKRKGEEQARKRREQEANKPVVKTETKTEAIAYKQVKKQSSSLPVGQEKVSVKGTKGEQTTAYQVTYVRGKEASRKKVSTKITKKPVDQVVLVGTYIATPQPPRSSASSPAATPRPSSSSDGVVKMSNSGICHAPGTTYYSRTIHYSSYTSLSACLSAGGRMPKR